MTNKQYKIIGLMSGTSLDGLDIAFCRFEKNEQGWEYSILQAETVEYTDEWKRRLQSIDKTSAGDFVQADIEYGQLTGKMVKKFLERFKIKPDFISSHGHTVFHQPSKGITCQIGRGSAIAAETGIPVICDFRSTDVALGGEGAPLVPIGDRLLFHGYDFCLNLGGFANISFEKKNQRIAFDICPVNTALNRLAVQLEKVYDEGGKIAASGITNETLMEKLNGLPYYRLDPPKSLGKEWLEEFFLPVLEQSGIVIQDKLRTVCEHISMQTAKVITGQGQGKLLITGGGAFNTFLVDRIRERSQANIVLPDPLTINYKEALIFAFLGLLRWRGEINCLKSVTGASSDSSCGAIYLPAKKNQ